MSQRRSLLDLTAAQSERIEQAVGVPIDHWGDRAPKGTLYPLLLEALVGDHTLTEYQAMSMRELQALMAEYVDQAEPDPKGPGAPS